MSFKVSDLSVLAYANNFTLWHYTTSDKSVNDDGYFDKSADMMRVNDLLIVNIDTDGTPSTKFYIVTGNTGSAVTITAYS